MITYRITEDTPYEADEGSCTTYGVAVCESGESSEELKFTISDIFVNWEDAQAFVERCNRLQLSVVHFAEAVDDALVELEAREELFSLISSGRLYWE